MMKVIPKGMLLVRLKVMMKGFPEESQPIKKQLMPVTTEAIRLVTKMVLASPLKRIISNILYRATDI